MHCAVWRASTFFSVFFRDFFFFFFPANLFHPCGHLVIYPKLLGFPYLITTKKKAAGLVLSQLFCVRDCADSTSVSVSQHALRSLCTSVKDHMSTFYKGGWQGNNGLSKITIRISFRISRLLLKRNRSEQYVSEANSRSVCPLDVL